MKKIQTQKERETESAREIAKLLKPFQRKMRLNKLNGGY